MLFECFYVLATNPSSTGTGHAPTIHTHAAMFMQESARKPETKAEIYEKSVRMDISW
jgi:hypothetical protein